MLFLATISSFKIWGILLMDSENKKQRPPHVPEENVYKSIHWTIILAYAIAALAIYLLLSSTT